MPLVGKLPVMVPGVPLVQKLVIVGGVIVLVTTAVDEYCATNASPWLFCAVTLYGEEALGEKFTVEQNSPATSRLLLASIATPKIAVIPQSVFPPLKA